MKCDKCECEIGVQRRFCGTCYDEQNMKDFTIRFYQNSSYAYGIRRSFESAERALEFAKTSAHSLEEYPQGDVTFTLSEHA